jgi:predicted anti-sigma-YlaC factor YlaD
MSWSLMKLLLTLTCEQSTRLVSESLDSDLPRGERLAVRLHAVSCRSCRRYRKQLAFLSQAVSRMADAVTSSSPRASLSPEVRERISRMLNRGG